MSIKTVTTILTEPDQVAGQVRSAAAFSRANDAHLHILGLAIAMAQSAVLHTALDAVPVGVDMQESITRLKAMVETVQDVLKNEDVRWNMDATTVAPTAFAAEVARQIRFSDLVIYQRGAEKMSAQQGRDLAEGVLFDGDCPLLLLPEGLQIDAPPSTPMIAWDGSSTALRATRLALPLLTRAKNVSVVLVNPPADAPDRSDPGGDFAQFLSRQGIRCEVSVCNRDDGGIAATLERRARELDRDLIVMGAYGHSRLRQAIFGGTTRDALSDGKIPVFMAH